MNRGTFLAKIKSSAFRLHLVLQLFEDHCAGSSPEGYVGIRNLKVKVAPKYYRPARCSPGPRMGTGSPRVMLHGWRPVLSQILTPDFGWSSAWLVSSPPKEVSPRCYLESFLTMLTDLPRVRQAAPPSNVSLQRCRYSTDR
jgi:hypothetical protein